jgi:hypothetical protein
MKTLAPILLALVLLVTGLAEAQVKKPEQVAASLRKTADAAAEQSVQSGQRGWIRDSRGQWGLRQRAR